MRVVGEGCNVHASYEMGWVDVKDEFDDWLN